MKPQMVQTHTPVFSSMILSLVACGSSGSTSSGSTEAGKTEAVSTDTTQETTCKTLERDDWADNVKTGINDFLATYGKNGEKYDKTNYAVFDWDNTCSIFDVGEQLFVYEIQTMSFGFSPDDLEGILTSGLNDLDKERKSFSEDGVGHSYREWIDDIETAYSYLWNTYGPFTPEGISDDVKEKMQSDSMWLEFAAKYRAIFDLVCYEEEHGMVAHCFFNFLDAFALNRIKNDRDRLIRRFLCQSVIQLIQVIAVDTYSVKAKRLEFRAEIKGIQNVLRVSVKLFLVIIDQPYEIVDFLSGCEHSRLPNLALVALAITNDQECAAVAAF